MLEKNAQEECLTPIEKEKLRQEMLEAANDPLFMKDLEDSMKSFKSSDHQMNQMIPKWTST